VRGLTRLDAAHNHTQPDPWPSPPGGCPFDDHLNSASPTETNSPFVDPNSPIGGSVRMTFGSETAVLAAAGRLRSSTVGADLGSRAADITYATGR
jgi:hypothetical protein